VFASSLFNSHYTTSHNINRLHQQAASTLGQTPATPYHVDYSSEQLVQSIGIHSRNNLTFRLEHDNIGNSNMEYYWPLLVVAVGSALFILTVFFWLLLTRNRLGCIPVEVMHIVFQIYAWFRLAMVRILPSTFRASEIIPGLWVGKLEDAHNLEALQSIRVKRVCAVMYGITPAFPEHFQYHMVNILDISSENLLPHIEPAVAFIETGLDAGEVVLVHCNQGKSRSGSIAIATLMKRQHLKFMDALLLAKQQRPSINPNSGFTSALLQYENMLSDPRGSASLIDETQQEVDENSRLLAY
jgi:predicted protein tyrosine phosphatase